MLETRSTGAINYPFVNPNHEVFDTHGNLYVSESGDYWDQSPDTGFIAIVRPDNQTELFHEGPFLFPYGLAIHPSGEWLCQAEISSLGSNGG